MKNLIIGMILGVVIAAGTVGAYQWDMDRSVTENMNKREESRHRQEMIDLQRQELYDTRINPC